ncbi:MAG: helix-turn-helix transcriptional regulator [Eubacterium sp.]|nr:helix-turn-helix transcriptional regulator [Eubacterium sp.]
MKTTNDLMNVLNNIDDKEGLNEYLNGLEKYKDLDAIKYYDTLRKEHGVSKSDVVKSSGISRTYCYQILNGTRKPGRNNAISLCLASHLTLVESLRYLEILQLGILYPKDIRDSLIIYAINRQYSVQQTNELLYSKNEATLDD